MSNPSSAPVACPYCGTHFLLSPAPGVVDAACPACRRTIRWQEVANPGLASTLQAPLSPHTERCHHHPDVAAAFRCKTCQLRVCLACAVQWPGGMVLCHACAARTKPTIAKGRTGRAIASLAAAGLATVVAVILMSVAVNTGLKGEGEQLAWGTGFQCLFLLPSAIGLDLAVSSIERSVPDSAMSWIGILWNGAYLLFSLGLTILGFIMM